MKDLPDAILEEVARGKSLERVLDQLCVLVEARAPGCTCSVLALDRESGTLRFAAGPSVPAAYAEALDGLTPGKNAGSCGAAAFLGEPVLVSDTRTDPRWAAFRDLAAHHAIVACWSVPIFGPGDRVVGTFAISFDAPRFPDAAELALLRRAGQLAGLAIERERVDEARRRIERQESDRLRIEGLGVLAAGIAHDFNNLLTGVVGNLSLAIDLADESDDLLQCLEDARRACDRAQLLANRFVTFSRGGEPGRQAVGFDELIHSMGSITFAGSGVALHFDDTGLALDGDRNQLSQIFHDLFVNAAQAMATEGRVTVEARPATPEEKSEAGLGDGDYLSIAVVDDGPGVPPEDLPHLFEPYFSRGAGSGLGLATVHSIVSAHGGQISVRSRPGEGARFELLLPAAVSAPRPASEAKPSPAPRATPVPRRVLLMDDEPAVLRTTEAMLVRNGYEVLTAGDGDEAVRVLRDERSARRGVDIAILDLTIRGGGGGREAVVRLREIAPELVSIAASGYSDDDVLQNARGHGFDAGLAKPFAMQDLLRTIEAACASAGH